ncbi:MAG: HPr(Ser) kinase/phosphatase [Candidatus Hydrogenedens sp.]|jgi:HPr kinase/phosphorylase|nr:HPr(Ser) kinase/phosphatase [Candidatus Hydrogenedens sp.]
MNFDKILENRKPFIPVSRLLERNANDMDFKLLAGFQGIDRPVYTWDINRPGLALSGYLDYFANDRVQILGNTEIHYMERVDPAELANRVVNMLAFEIPVFILSRNLLPQPIFLDMCNRYGIPVLRSSLTTDELISKIILFLAEEFAPSSTIHATAVDVYGVGCLIMGKAGIGKSESALELVERGHRLVADDMVQIQRRGNSIHVKTHHVTKHNMEIRGVGVIDLRYIFGVGSVRDFKRIGLIIELVEADPELQFDRLGMSMPFVEILGARIPYLNIPVRPGRNIAIIIEVAALNWRLKEMGVDSAKILDEAVRANNLRRNRPPLKPEKKKDLW